jgi:hypothetical protein
LRFSQFTPYFSSDIIMIAFAGHTSVQTPQPLQ